MLVLSRYVGQEIYLFDQLSSKLIAKVRVTQIRNGTDGGEKKALIGISAPEHIAIFREELVTKPSSKPRLVCDRDLGQWECLDADGNCLWTETDEESARIRFKLEKEGFNV